MIMIHNTVYHSISEISRKNEENHIIKKFLLTFMVKLLYNVYSEGYFTLF